MIRLLSVTFVLLVASWATAQPAKESGLCRVQVNMKKLQSFTPAQHSLGDYWEKVAKAYPKYSWLDATVWRQTETIEFVSLSADESVVVLTGNFRESTEKLADELRSRIPKKASPSESASFSDDLLKNLDERAIVRAVDERSIALVTSDQAFERWCDLNSELRSAGKEAIELVRKEQEDAAIYFVVETTETSAQLPQCQLSGCLELGAPTTLRVTAKGLSQAIPTAVIENAVQAINSTRFAAETAIREGIHQLVIEERRHSTQGPTLTEFFGLDRQGEPLVTVLTQFRIHAYRDGDNHQLSLVVPWKRP